MATSPAWHCSYRLDGAPMVAHPPICDQARVKQALERNAVRHRIVFRTHRQRSRAVVATRRNGIRTAVREALAGLSRNLPRPSEDISDALTVLSALLQIRIEDLGGDEAIAELARQTLEPGTAGLVTRAASQATRCDLRAAGGTTSARRPGTRPSGGRRRAAAGPPPGRRTHVMQGIQLTMTLPAPASTCPRGQSLGNRSV